MMKWENSECLEDDCSGLSVFCLLVLELGELLKNHKGLHRLKNKKNRKGNRTNTTKLSLTVKLKYSWRLLCLISFALSYF